VDTASDLVNLAFSPAVTYMRKQTRPKLFLWNRTERLRERTK